MSNQQDARISGFLMKTYEILESGKYADVVSWNPEGAGFIVHDTKGFADRVLPSYFKHNNFQSFVRQLNMYGFHKIRTPRTEMLYTHPLFCYGQKYTCEPCRHLIKEICRKAQKKMQKARDGKSSQRSIEANIHPECEASAVERPRNPNQVRCRSSLTSLLNINWSLLEEQRFLLEDMKKEWNRMERATPANLELLQIYKENTPGMLQGVPTPGDNFRLFREQRQVATQAVDLYLNVSRQMLSKLCQESQHLLQHEQERFAETNTSLSHFH